MIKLQRRQFTLGAGAMLGWAVGLGFAAGLGTRPARALEPEAAKAHVDRTVDLVIGLIQANTSRSETARSLRQIFDQQTALPQIARFCAGKYWADMSADQQPHYVDAFSNYLAYDYAGYFSGQASGDANDLKSKLAIIETIDAGGKGVLVKSEFSPGRQAPVPVDWLISDRSGRVAISDLVVAGISLAVTQREIVQGMFEQAGGSAARVIETLEAR